MLIKIRRKPYLVRRVGGSRGMGVTVPELFLEANGRQDGEPMEVHQYIDENGILYIVPDEKAEEFERQRRS